ncbi:MAG: hypothetical protein ABIZ64_11405 [Casimicrobium sp.]
MNLIPAIRLSKTATKLSAAIAATLLTMAAHSAPTIPSNFQRVLVDGSATAFTTLAGQGASFNVLYDGGLFHLWYRTDATVYTITEIRHATSVDGINFATVGGNFSFASNPFPTGTAPVLYYDAVSKVGATFKMIHWTSNGDAGTYPAYDYNNSVSNIGASASNTVMTHLGPLGGGTIGQTAGSFGIVNGNWYGQCGTTGQEICRSPYTDGTPPTVAASIYPSVLNAGSIFTGAGFPTGYINNHGDINVGTSGLDLAFTIRTDQSSGARANKQVYYSNSADNGATWTAITPLLTGTPTLSNAAFGAANFAHPELVSAPLGYKLYVSAQDNAGNFVIAVAGNVPPVVVPSTPVPTVSPIGLGLTGLLVFIGALLGLRRKKQTA